jgi:ectoine hydroxylase-related dioxygenase (phytanoyl-CoA dioxygenase family)
MPPGTPMSPDDMAAFERDGFVLQRAVFRPDEVAVVNDTIRNDPVIRDTTYALQDSTGASTELALWYTMNDDVFGAIAQSRRIAGAVQTLLGGPVCFYHSKLTLKRPRVGGAWDWHQDYGYWYRHGYLYPDMASVFIAIDASTRANGCLQVLRGSHRMGRLEHGAVGGQTGADMERVTEAMRTLEHVHVEMAPGDALFFHANLLHASGRNDSAHSRNVLLNCYSRADNAPYKSGPAISHTPLGALRDDDLVIFKGRPIDKQQHRFRVPQA